MNFLGALSTVDKVISGIGGINNGAKGIFGISNQDERSKKLMEYQAELNKKAAEHTNQLNKEMWDYTNYENQVKHLKEAGLNPGLLYGMSGGGGVSAAGGQDAGASGVGASQKEMLGLQAQQIAAQTNLANAEAEKARADAKKTSGADTELTNALTELNKAKKETEKTTQNLQKAQESVEWVRQNEVAANAQQLWSASQNFLALARKNGLEGDITEKAKEDIVDSYRLKNLEIWSEFILNNEKLKTNKAMQAQLYSQVQRVQNEAEYWDGLIEIGKALNNIRTQGNNIKQEEINILKDKAESMVRFLDKKCSYLGQENARAWIKSATTIMDSLGSNFEKVMGVMGKTGKLGKMLTKQTEKTKTKMNDSQTKEIINEWNVIGW